MSETLITTDAAPAAAASTPAGEVAPAAAAPVGDQPQPTSEAGSVSPEGDGQGAGNEPAANGGTPEGETPEGGKVEVAPGAPEAYADFSMPEGFEIDGATLEGLTSTAKGLNLTQEQAQALVDLGVKQAEGIMSKLAPALEVAEQAAAVPVPMREHWKTAWTEQTKSDPEIGGDKLAAALPVAKQVLDTLGTPALAELLHTTGLGSHPEVLRLLHKVGKAISEDVLVNRNGGEGRQARDPAKVLYPNMN